MPRRSPYVMRHVTGEEKGELEARAQGVHVTDRDVDGHSFGCYLNNAKVRTLRR